MILLIALIIGLILAIVEEAQAAGRNFLAWGIIVCFIVALIVSQTKLA